MQHHTFERDITLDDADAFQLGNFIEPIEISNDIRRKKPDALVGRVIIFLMFQIDLIEGSLRFPKF
jgi:hypothetical protein